MSYRADITAAAAGTLSLAMDEDLARAIERTGATQADLRLIDPREHSKDQHGKVFALCSEISEWSGHGNTDLIFWGWVSPEEARYELTDRFCALEGLQRFSMADVDMGDVPGVYNLPGGFLLIPRRANEAAAGQTGRGRRAVHLHMSVLSQVHHLRQARRYAPHRRHTGRAQQKHR